MLRALLTALALCLLMPAGPASAQDLQTILQNNADEIAKPGRQTVSAVIDELVASGLPEAATFLERWASKEVVQRADGQFFFGKSKNGTYTLFDIATGAEAGQADKSDITEVKPNGGVRKVIGTALVQFQLLDPDLEKRRTAVENIARSPGTEQLGPLRASIDGETDPDLKQIKTILATRLTAQFGDTPEARIDAIQSLSERMDIETRSSLSQILTTKRIAVAALPEDINLAGLVTPGTDLTYPEAYELLVGAGLAKETVTEADIKPALTDAVRDGKVGGVAVGLLDDPEQRLKAYAALVAEGAAQPVLTEAARKELVDAHVIADVYAEPNVEITAAARQALDSIETRVALNQGLDIGLDALSLASIYFLAAIGLAITFGVMGVINMAHGEFIMIGAYTGYVVQLVIPNYTASLIVALPLAFAVTFGAGVAMERLVIRHLYHRPLETLLATFGISIALQQLAKNIFGTQARPLTSPAWLDGAWSINDVVQISNIRIAIFVLAVLFLILILFVLNRTRLGLEVRAVTQNPGMAASMGINPDRINMLTFGFGSGIAGIAGVAIGLYAKVTSEMGADYIVQSFMTVVVGGVGNVWGTLAGAGMIGTFQKGVEWLNPSNTLAAQTYMILFIILFIQFRPKGIVALKGRAAGD